MITVNKLSFIALNITFGIFSMHLSTGESIKDIKLRRAILNSKSDNYINALHVATPLLLTSPFLLARGATQYRIGSTLLRQNYTPMGSLLKTAGSRNIALGIAVTAPFTLFYQDLNQDFQKEKLNQANNPSILKLEKRGKIITLDE